ncbi:hypothetical protein GCM10010372_04510 [Streptomyces tauricus]|uniref:hypothetical protein n=1 Tax=Streptomyces tauricus TaxID=68274 RepID=UPI0016798E8D|nr:hypothetical protein [Streptomyces tauricus]GHA08268.1 hypothetical protein GCM10010372_04510 [Streptomyces tauricus]
MLRDCARRESVAAFAKTYGAAFLMANEKITDEADELLAFYDLHPEHWIPTT